MINLPRFLVLACLVLAVSSVPISKRDDMERVEKVVEKAVARELLNKEQGVDTEKIVREAVKDEKPTEAQRLVEDLQVEHAVIADEEATKEHHNIDKVEKEMKHEALVDDEKQEERQKERRAADEEEEEDKARAEPMSSGEEEEDKARAAPMSSGEEEEDRQKERRAADEEEEEDKARAEPLTDSEEKHEEVHAERQIAEEEKEEVKDIKKEEKIPVAERILAETSAIIATEKEAMMTNPCETVNFKYYQPDPNHPSKYYLCDPWGTFTHHTCKNEMVWDKWTLKCQMKEDIRNLTSLIPEPILKMSLFNCTTKAQECQNGGQCIEKDNVFACKCEGKFTGETCELSISDIDMFTNIMKGNATLKDYAAKLIDESADMDISYYEKYEKILGKAIYEKMMSYLRKNKKSLVRYDILVNSLVEDLLVDVYPDAEFLRSFNASSKSILTIVRLIPNLLSYAKYSSERYEQVFVQYQRVLNELFGYLNVTCPNMTTEAKVYTELTKLFLKDEKSAKMIEQETSKTDMDAIKKYGRRFFKDESKTEEIVKKTIKADFDITLEKTYKLHALLVTFEKAVAQEYKNNPEFVHEKLSKTTLPGVKEVIHLFDEIQTVNIQIWNSLVSYGFWYITNMFVAPTPIVDAQIDM